MIAILKNNMRRLETQIIILLVVFTTVAAVAAVFVSTGMKQIWDVAVVSDVPVEIGSEQVKVTQMETAPARSDLVTGKYDAIITMNADGSYTVDSIKSEDATIKLLDALEGKQDAPVLFSNRGTGTNVLGFLMMFLLFMGSMCMSMFADDKTYGQLDRVAASPVKISTYLLAQCLFDFCFLFFPTIVTLMLVKVISGVELGYSFLQLACLIALICALSTTFSLLLFAFLPNKDDSAKMTGNFIIILTSILAGGFYAFDKGNRALEYLITVLPQKAFLTLANSLEQGAVLTAYLPALVYLLALIVTFYCASVVKTKRNYVNKR
ncbi:MAG TPA: ABC transporter permease [Clostridiales bacterium]|nr:ABC transporter permease [Clostridiales bacterium]